MDPVTVGRNIRQARGATRQGELAIMVGVTQSAVSAWESGRKAPSLKRLVQLAGVLDTSVEALLSDTRASV